MAFVDDPHRHQQDPRTDVQRPADQEIQVRLLQFEFAGVFLPFDERVLELDLAHEPDAVGKLVSDEQHEAMEVQLPFPGCFVVVVKLHVPRQPGFRSVGGARSLCVRRRGCRQEREPDESL